MLLNCWKVGGIRMKLLIKFGLAIDLIILIASFILENFVYNGFEIYKTVELVSVIAFILLIYSLPMNYASYKIENHTYNLAHLTYWINISISYSSQCYNRQIYCIKKRIKTLWLYLEHN